MTQQPMIGRRHNLTPVTDSFTHYTAMDTATLDALNKASSLDLPPYYRTRNHPWVDKSW